jgi:hypothetical protein
LEGVLEKQKFQLNKSAILIWSMLSNILHINNLTGNTENKEGGSGLYVFFRHENELIIYQYFEIP